MIDYAFIGARLKEARIRKNMTQEQLAAMTDVGSTHISHIETGMTIPSTKLLVQMMNILDCDPAEVLCMETRSARPALNGRLSDLVADCNEDEIKIITDTVTALRVSMHSTSAGSQSRIFITDTVTALKASLHRNRSEDK
mgnify:CR=1 FL=1